MIPRRYGHYVYGVIQSGFTSAAATGIAAARAPGGFQLPNWVASWLLAWLIMAPLVLMLAPLIRRFTETLTQE